MRGHMQQKVQSSGCCTQPGTPVDVGEFPDVETGSLPVSHFADTPTENDELQPDAGNRGVERDPEKTGNAADFSGKSPACRVMIGMIRVYQKIVSPWIPCCCRFEPSCSHYGVEAFRKRGFWAGTILTIWRLLRCQPFCRGGYDPVPDKGFRRVDSDNHQK